MKLSTEEKIMYEVMMAIYESGIPISFKGSMVLKAYLLEVGYSNEIRHTVDIDGNWVCQSLPSSKNMVISLQQAMDKKGIPLIVKIERDYGQGRSAGFELFDKETGIMLFSMDLDVKCLSSSSRIYEIDGFHFLGVSPTQMIADKISTISTDKVFRRIKDLVDLYYFSHVFEIDKNEIIKHLQIDEKNIGDFNGFIFRTNELKHAYEKFRFTGDIGKPPFEVIYQTVCFYIHDFLPNVKF